MKLYLVLFVLVFAKHSLQTSLREPRKVNLYKDGSSPTRSLPWTSMESTSELIADDLQEHRLYTTYWNLSSPGTGGFYGGGVAHLLTNGTNFTPIVTKQVGIETGNGIIVDLRFEKVYYCDGTNLSRCELDGSNVETLLRFPSGWCEGLAMDQDARQLYLSWWDPADYEGIIYRWGTDGAESPERLYSTNSDIEGVALDTARGFLFFLKFPNEVWRINLDDGGDATRLATSQKGVKYDARAFGIATNVNSGQLYWSVQFSGNFSTCGVFTCSYITESCVPTQIYANNYDAYYYGLVVDLTSSSLFLASDYDLFRMNLDGSNPVKIYYGYSSKAALQFLGLAAAFYTDETNCCRQSENPKCYQEEVYACVCQYDPFCCDVAWDAQCIDDISVYGCNLTCPPYQSPPAFDPVLYSLEASASADAYVTATWKPSMEGVFRVYVNMPAASSISDLGFLVFAFASLEENPTACRYNSEAHWTNYNNVTRHLYDRFDVLVQNASQPVYLSFICPSIVSDHAQFSVSIVENVRSSSVRTAEPYDFMDSMFPYRTKAVVLDLDTKDAYVDCSISGSSAIPLFSTFLPTLGNIGYSDDLVLPLTVFPEQTVVANSSIRTMVQGLPGAAAFQSYLIENGTVLTYQSDKSYLSEMVYNLSSEVSWPATLDLRINAWGGLFIGGNNLFRASVLLDPKVTSTSMTTILDDTSGHRSFSEDVGDKVVFSWKFGLSSISLSDPILSDVVEGINIQMTGNAIAVDLSNQRLYVCGFVTNETSETFCVFRMGVDGSDRSCVIQSLNPLLSVAFDEAGSMLYISTWDPQAGVSQIQKWDTDLGSSLVEVLYFPNSVVDGLAVDSARRRLVFKTDDGSIWTSMLNGTAPSILASKASAYAIALGPQGSLYWTQRSGGLWNCSTTSCTPQLVFFNTSFTSYSGLVVDAKDHRILLAADSEIIELMAGEYQDVYNMQGRGVVDSLAACFDTLIPAPSPLPSSHNVTRRMNPVMFSFETTSTSLDYVHTNWSICRTGVYHVFVNLPELDPSLDQKGFVVLAYASKNPFPTACSYNDTAGWTNFDNVTNSLLDGFEVHGQAGEVVYFGFSCPDIITKEAIFSLSILERDPSELNGQSSPIEKVTRLSSNIQSSCIDTQTQWMILYPGFQMRWNDVVSYAESATYQLPLCAEQLPPNSTFYFHTIVEGHPGAAAFQSYLYGGKKLIGYDSDKHFISEIVTSSISSDTLPSPLYLVVKGYGGQFVSGVNGFDISVFLEFQ